MTRSSPAGNLHVLRHSAPAAIRQPSPMTALFKIVAYPIPNQAAVAHRMQPPCNNGPVPDGRSSPLPHISARVGVQHERCPHIEFPLNGMRPVSARSTAPYQTLLFSQEAARCPPVMAFSRPKRRALSVGTQLVYCDGFAPLAHAVLFAFPHVVGVWRTRRRAVHGHRRSFAGEHCSLNYYNAPTTNCKPLPNVLQYSSNHKEVVLWQSK